ncbi:hypothetical protein HPP92_018023 [Vanilla planifolia]|uniref:Uncharacterized protein n=1 Tax=Vanilla planifolia TaxID=51239 RepID=A0A835QCP3_VANPL|nr:hypothetical protein HPP92_018023 [Vanilla planifolia]
MDCVTPASSTSNPHLGPGFTAATPAASGWAIDVDTIEWQGMPSAANTQRSGPAAPPTMTSRLVTSSDWHPCETGK